MRKVLITGGAGYIGSHTCKALAQAGFTPVTYDNLSTGHRWAVKWGPLETGDIRDPRRLGEVISTHAPDAVIHFAASAYVGESMADPGKYYDNNVVGTLRLLEAIKEHSISNLVFSSSCATYGIPDRLPIREEDDQRPINPYGASKLICERMIMDFAAATGLNWMALRYFNAAGADPDGEIGEDHDPETHLIPLILFAASGRRPSVSILGDDYDTRDGTCVRDFVHVSDLASAHVRALQCLLEGGKPMALNIGTGNGTTVREAIKAVEAVTGFTVPTVVAPRRNGDPAELVSDPSKAKQVLGWKPRLSSIVDITSTAWLWHQAAAERNAARNFGSKQGAVREACVDMVEQS